MSSLSGALAREAREREDAAARDKDAREERMRVLQEKLHDRKTAQARSRDKTFKFADAQRLAAAAAAAAAAPPPPALPIAASTKPSRAGSRAPTQPPSQQGSRMTTARRSTVGAALSDVPPPAATAADLARALATSATVANGAADRVDEESLDASVDEVEMEGEDELPLDRNSLAAAARSEPPEEDAAAMAGADDSFDATGLDASGMGGEDALPPAEPAPPAPEDEDVL
jgi:hypothetical protein